MRWGSGSTLKGSSTNTKRNCCVRKAARRCRASCTASHCQLRTLVSCSRLVWLSVSGCRHWRMSRSNTSGLNLAVDLPHATVQCRLGQARPGHLHRMVADWDCIVRKLVRVEMAGSSQVKADHDVIREPSHDAASDRAVPRCTDALDEARLTPLACAGQNSTSSSS